MTWLLSRALRGLVSVGRMEGDHQRAARLFGAAVRLREGVGVTVIPPEQAECDRNLATLHSSLGDDPFASALVAGRAMSAEQAIEYALADEGPGVGGQGSGAGVGRQGTDSSPQAPEPWPLTPRETENAGLVARGRNTRQIAEALVVSERTVEWYVSPGSITTMTTGSTANANYAKGWGVSGGNWTHLGGLPGTATGMARRSDGICWVVLTNTERVGAGTRLEDSIPTMMNNVLAKVAAWPTEDLF